MECGVICLIGLTRPLLALPGCRTVLGVMPALYLNMSWMASALFVRGEVVYDESKTVCFSFPNAADSHQNHEKASSSEIPCIIEVHGNHSSPPLSNAESSKFNPSSAPTGTP